jgi:DNA-directed RNA polymerase specialized sigma24 family protein
MNHASPASIPPTTLAEVFERDINHLLWLAEAIVGDPLIAESCVADAMVRADGSAYVTPKWRDLWIRRCVAREAVERNSADIRRIAADYMRDPIRTRPHGPADWDHNAIGSLPATKISESLSVFERAALILHAYLGFSAHDCGLLLDCHWSVIEAACSNAVWRISGTHIQARKDFKELGVQR